MAFKIQGLSAENNCISRWETMISGGKQINRSFFYDEDNITIYFTYFSEFNRPWKGAAYVEVFLLCILFVLSMVENCFILVYIRKYKKLRTITNLFVCNLAVGDILYVLSVPLVAAVRITGSWNLGDGMCHLLNYGMFVCSVSMIWTMVAISIDRYICINVNASASKRLGPVHVAIICAGIWLTSASCFLPTALFFHVQVIELEQGEIRFCTLTWPSGHVDYSILFTAMLLVFGFGLPIIIIGYNYFNIFKKFWSSKRAIDTVAHNVSRRERGYKTRRKRDLRVVKTLVLLVVLFVMMWLPLVVVFSMIRDDIVNSKNNMPSYGLTWALMIAYLNPCINPFLYCFMNVDFVRKLSSWCRRHRDSDEETTVARVNIHDNQTSVANM